MKECVVERIENLAEYETKVERLHYLACCLNKIAKESNLDISITEEMVKIADSMKNFEFLIKARKVQID